MISNSTGRASCEYFSHVFEGTLWHYFSAIFILVTIINCSLLAIGGNMFVGYLIYSTRQLWTKKHVLIINLICVDLLTATVSIPSYMTFIFFFILGESSCAARDVHLVTSTISLNMTVINLCLISYERYFAVVYPYRYHTYFTARRLVLLACASWFYGSLLALPVLGKITLPWEGWEIVCVAAKMIVVIHVVSSLVYYSRICRVASVHQNSISRASTRSRKLSKGSKTFLYIVVAFLVCALPSCAIYFVHDPPIEAEYFAYGCSFSSCGLNWAIYAVRSEDIQTVIDRKMKRRITSGTVQATQTGGE